ncbi:MAG: ABC transporter ATP-binding protein [Caldilineaceae bacterium]
MPEPERKNTQQNPPRMIAGPGHGPGHRGMGVVERATDARGTVRRLWTYLSREKVALLGVGAMVLCSTVLQMISPWFLGHIIDNYIIPGDLAGLARMCAIMLGMWVVIALLSWLVIYVMAGVAQRTVRALRTDLFDNLEKLSLGFFDSHSHGDLMSRLTNDMETINMVLSESLTSMISGVMLVIGVTGMMLWINLPLAIITLVTTPLLVVGVVRWVGKRTRVGFRRQQASLGTLNGIIEETISGQRVVKAYVREKETIAEFAVANQQLRSDATRAQIYSGFMGPVMNFVNKISLAVVVTAGAWMAVMGMATVGTVASFINYTRQFGRPLTDIANLYNQIQGAIAGAERIFETIDEPATVVDAPDALPLEDITGDVELNDVSFAYEEGVPVLKHVSLHAEPGQIVALVGPTGSGKTTTVNMLSRFYDIDEGQIFIDGHEIRAIKQDDLRRQLGIVLQDTFLFAGTVMENIRYGRLDATDEEVMQAARMANADSFIHRLPYGYDTMLSERAGNLSEGQRQMLAIARAVLANPGILILDEATSSVDTRTELQIQDAMLRLMEGRTSFVIAHRLSTIRNADQILVVHNGEIIERGTHEGLLAAEGFYYNLYTSQFQVDGATSPAEVAA